MLCHQLTLLQQWQIILLFVSSVGGTGELQELQQTAPRAGYLYGYHYHHTLALGGFLGLVLIKITAIVVVLATLITGGLLIKLFGLGLVFGSTRLPYNNNNTFPPPYNTNYYRAIVQPRLDIVKTIFTLMEVDTETCKAALVCLLDKEAVQSPLLDSAFKFIMDNVWKVEIGREKFEDCTDLYLKCNNLIEEN